MGTSTSTSAATGASSESPSPSPIGSTGYIDMTLIRACAAQLKCSMSAHLHIEDVRRRDDALKLLAMPEHFFGPSAFLVFVPSHINMSVASLVALGFTASARRLIDAHLEGEAPFLPVAVKELHYRQFFECKFFAILGQFMTTMHYALTAANNIEVTYSGSAEEETPLLFQMREAFDAADECIEASFRVPLFKPRDLSVMEMNDPWRSPKALCKLELCKQGVFSNVAIHDNLQQVVSVNVRVIQSFGVAVQSFHHSMKDKDKLRALCDAWFFAATLESAPDSQRGVHCDEKGSAKRVSSAFLSGSVRCMPMLVWTISVSCDELTYALLDVGADVNVSAVDCLTPLTTAVAMDNYVVAKCLLARGASVGAQALSSGLTPLHFVLSRRMVRLLAGHFADGSAVSWEGVGVAVPALLLQTGADRTNDDAQVLEELISIYGIEALDVPTDAQIAAHLKATGERWPTVVEAAFVSSALTPLRKAVELGFRKPLARPSFPVVEEWTASAAVQTFRRKSYPDGPSSAETMAKKCWAFLFG